MLATGLALAAVIGLALGIMGGGGSILTVPVFVYLLDFGAKEAIALSLAVVGAVSAFGAVGHWRVGNVNTRVALVFAPVAMVGTYGGARLAAFVSGSTQLLLFAAVMLVAAYFMLTGRDVTETAGPRVSRGPGGPQSGAAFGGSASAAESSSARSRSLRVALIVVEGLGVGVLTGLVGVGGGFLIVPTLVLLMGLPMKEAVGTSLLVIALKSAAGFYGYLGVVEVPWDFLVGFTAVAVGGIGVGTYMIRYVSQGMLRRAFATFLVVMGGFILYQNRAVLTATSPAKAGGERGDGLELEARPVSSGNPIDVEYAKTEKNT